MSEAVVLIHGLWLNGLDMSLLRRRLRRRYGFDTHQFSYPTVRATLGQNVRRLIRFIDGIDAGTVHLVGHSLGGVLALQACRRCPTQKIGRIICLGSPLVASAPAALMTRYSVGRRIIGPTLREAVLLDPPDRVGEGLEVGVIAGTLAAGLGMMLGVLERPNDGVVSVRETKLPGIADHIEMPLNHLGLILAPQAAKQVAAFLRDGHFS